MPKSKIITGLKEAVRHARERNVSNDAEKYVTIDYTNYRGERSKRRVCPSTIFFGSNEWHPEPQWLLEAWDFEKEAFRNFAVRDIHEWLPAAVEPQTRDDA